MRDLFAVTTIFAASAIVLGGCSCSARPSPGRDAGTLDAFALDGAPSDAGHDASLRPDATVDAGMDAALASDVGIDARAIDANVVDASLDSGCTPGATRPCTVMCMGGSTAPGVERCLGGTVWSGCFVPTELCGNGVDDDGDGMTDEDCVAVGGCMWIHPQCQGQLTLNQWCAQVGMHLVAGRRCPVAGSSVVPLDIAYGDYPLCCCNAVSMCVPECTDPSCAACVVWDEIQCCL